MFGKAKDSILAIDLSPEAVRLLDVSIRRGVPMISTMACGSPEEGTIDTLPERQIKAAPNISSPSIISKPIAASPPCRPTSSPRDPS